ncbi:hypothetical protein PN462_17180, partial [Spirulina sp. CS-785/01]|uniref:hypothetical protein n=1 Tax=Spirulina sp. CS-785/01 TaxID=3021716 RepID=UPI00232D3537
ATGATGATGATAIAGNPTILDFTPIWQSILEDLEEDVLLGNACQTVPELELELDDDGEEMELEEEEDQEYDQECRPVSEEGEGEL